MSATHASTEDHDEPGRYEIRLKGHLDVRWADRFEGLCFLFLLGIAGLYARQVEDAGWLGLAGFLLLSLSWALNLAFVFAEAFLLPLLASAAPTFVEGVRW